MQYVREFCNKLGVPVRQDVYGNLLATYSRGKTLSPVVFTSHMDHPGFEVVSVRGTLAKVCLLGGVNPKHFEKAKIIIYSAGKPLKGRVVKKTGKYFLVRTVKPVAPKNFGCFDLPACQFRNGRIYTKAADNVMSVALLLNLLSTLSRKKTKTHALCLFTRAEEVGFIGALGLIRNNFIPKQYPLVVLETSSAKAGKIKIGGGPALRVGDRWSTFSSELDVWFRETAGKSFQFQRALLPGGRCEASVYVTAGYQAGCLALPLGNYHNQGRKGPAAEYVSQSDYSLLLEWLEKLAVSPRPRSIGLQNQKLLQKRFSKLKHRLTV